MKYFIIGLIGVIFVWLSGVSVLAQTRGEGWKLYYIDESAGNRYYYDKGSIESPQKGIIKVWQKITERTKSEEEQDKYKMRLQINCRQKTYETLSYTEYDVAKERVLTSTEYKENPPKSNLPLDSRMRALFENTCP